MKNRVAKLTQIRKIEIFEEEIPLLREGQILVAIKSVGICGSDMHYFKEGGLGSFKNPLPMYMGHEPSGVIVDANGSTKFKEGDRVAVEPGMPCVTSYWSMKGKHNLCEKMYDAIKYFHKVTFIQIHTLGSYLLSNFVYYSILPIVGVKAY
jgi:L-iditol 2-dehydrogenase